MSKKRLGDGHPAVAIRCHNLSDLYVTQVRFSEAEPLSLRALAIFQERFGAEHPNSKTVFNSYLNLIIQAIQAEQTDTLSDHPMTQDLIPKLRAYLAQQGQE